MNIDDDDLIAAAGAMTSEDLHSELEMFVVRSEAHWPDWLYRQYHPYRSDVEIDAHMFDQAIAAVGRNHGPELLHNLYSSGKLDIGFHPGVVATAWSMAEFPESHELDWWDLFSRAGYTHNGQPAPPAPRPRHPVTLYRGCTPDRRFGMAWTGTVEIARWFAEHPRLNGTGKVYVARVLPRAVLAYIGESECGEDEYVIDSSPVYLNDKTVRLLD
jgi:hypothetical protein